MQYLKNLLILLFLSIFISQAVSTTRTINVQNFSFNPTPTTVTVGDTIIWQWVSGTHTTTSTSVPSGASTWDSPITSSNQTYVYKITTAGTYNYKCTPHESMGMTGTITANPIGITPLGSIIPKDYKLEQNYPNPFNPSTNIKFDIPVSGQVNIKVYDIIGNEIKTLVDGELKAGSYSVDFDASSITSGVYFYKMITVNFTSTKKMILVK